MALGGVMFRARCLVLAGAQFLGRLHPSRVGHQLDDVGSLSVASGHCAAHRWHLWIGPAGRRRHASSLAIPPREDGRWLTGIGVGVVFSYLAFIMFLLTPGPSYVLEAPNDDRSVLIVNRIILHAGGFPVYEPRNWPVYV